MLKAAEYQGDLIVSRNGSHGSIYDANTTQILKTAMQKFVKIRNWMIMKCHTAT